jgi:O-antigen ligase
VGQGGYGLGARSGVGVLLWWAIGAGWLFGAWPRGPVPRAALVTGALLGGLTLLTGLSVLWAESEELAFIEFDRALVYLGLFAAVVLASRPGQAGRWSDGLALGVAVVALLALGQRLFPDLFPEPDQGRFLPGTDSRLSYPVDYWNGLGILLGLGAPLLLRSALAARTALWRGLALAALPAVLTATYLTSSRGGAGAAIVGLVVLLVLSRRAVPVALAAAVASAGAALAIVLFESRDVLVNGPFGTGDAVSEGRTMALLLLLICAACGFAHVLLSRTRLAGLRLGRGQARALALAAAAVAVVALAVVNPAELLDDFKEPPNSTVAEGEFVSSHLFSGAGSGRWQFWGEALDQWAEHPLAGQGAGSFGSYWLEHTPITFFVRDAHSLYLETLGELGLIGLLLLLGALGVTLAAAAGRLRAGTGDDRLAIAALAAAFGGFLFGAALDWIWELPAVGGVGIAVMALLTGPATLPAGEPARTWRRPGRLARVGVGAAALAAVVLVALPWLVQREVRASREAARAGDLDAARDHAQSARALQPWASSPRLQLALAEERAGNLPAARSAIAGAIERDRRDWELWLVSARIATKLGDLDAAERALARSRELNPRSPLFLTGTP